MMHQKYKLPTITILFLLIIGLTISVTGQDTYGEAPDLEAQVATGELPPIEERIPMNPKVVTTDEIGIYGGTLRMSDTGTRLDEAFRIRNAGLFRYDFGVSEFEPDLAAGFEFSNDNRTLTITLREGLHWSDGETFDANDIAWWWENLQTNEEYTPNFASDGFWAFGGELAVFELIDDNTFSWTWSVPNPTSMDRFGRTYFSGQGSLYVPSHYIEQFHIDFNPDANAMAEEAGFTNWVDWLGTYANATAMFTPSAWNTDIPVMDAWVPVETSSNLIVMERNPYFHWVDQDGNQLPYIDRVEVSLASDQELYTLQATTGEIDFAVRFLNASDLQLLRSSEESGDYTLHIAQTLRASEYTLFFNRTVQDPVLNELFNSLEFRTAVSNSINRANMNDILFFGLAEAHPPTHLRTMPWFREEWSDADYLNYAPDTANTLLDNLGLSERDSEGFRLSSDGERISIIVETFDNFLEGCEVIIEDLSQIGIELICREVSIELIEQNREENNYHAIMWALDRGTLFGRGTPDNFAFESVMNHQWAPQWALWLTSNGADGIEPPQEIKDLDELWTAFSMLASNSPEAVEVGGEYFSYFAEQLPFIPTLGLPPQPVIYSNSLRNVPTEGITWSSDHNFYAPFHLEEWFFTN